MLCLLKRRMAAEDSSAAEKLEESSGKKEKQMDEKEKNGKQVDEKEMNEKQMNEKEMSEKQMDEKEKNGKQVDGKQMNEKEMNEKEIDEKEIDEKEINGILMKELGFANLDFLRKKRTGAPEAIFCPGKKPEQVAEIMQELMKTREPIMATRATEKDFAAVHELIPQAKYHEDAGIITVNERDPQGAPVAVVTAGTADIPVAEEAAVTAETLGNRVDRIYDVGVAGIHRLFEKLDRIRAASAVIVVAGMEGALASVVGGLVDTPVIAVPTSIGYGANLGGLSALLSMLNSCANGVGIVNIDNGYGAACLVSKMTKKQSTRSRSSMIEKNTKDRPQSDNVREDRL